MSQNAQVCTKPAASTASGHRHVSVRPSLPEQPCSHSHARVDHHPHRDEEPRRYRHSRQADVVAAPGLSAKVTEAGRKPTTRAATDGHRRRAPASSVRRRSPRAALAVREGRHDAPPGRRPRRSTGPRRGGRETSQHVSEGLPLPVRQRTEVGRPWPHGSPRRHAGACVGPPAAGGRAPRDRPGGGGVALPAPCFAARSRAGPSPAGTPRAVRSASPGREGRPTATSGLPTCIGVRSTSARQPGRTTPRRLPPPTTAGSRATGPAAAGRAARRSRRPTDVVVVIVHNVNDVNDSAG